MKSGSDTPTFFVWDGCDVGKRASVFFSMAHNDVQIQPDGSIAISRTENIGLLGEAIAAQWAMSNGWEILHHRWHCRWGELDLIIHQPFDSTLPKEAQQHRVPNPHGMNDGQALIFVEVKTRSANNWDANGLMAITPEKQRKLWQTAELFLSTFPRYAMMPCRFDLVLIQHRRSPKPNVRKSIVYGQPALLSDPLLLAQSREDFLILPPCPQIQSKLRDGSPWVRLGKNLFRVEQHLENIFER